MADICLEFAEASQSIEALRAAAYRFISDGSCQIDRVDAVFRCTLVAARTSKLGEADLRERFLAPVTDENLRESIEQKTHATRDVILALAFGALAQAEAIEQA